MSFDIDKAMLASGLLGYDTPIHIITSMAKYGYLNKEAFVLLLVFKGGMNMELIGYVGIEKVINEIGILFNTRVLSYSINCSGGILAVLIRILNRFADLLNIDERLKINNNHDVDYVYYRLKEIIPEVNREIILYLRNMENLGHIEMNRLSGFMRHYGIHLICTCNSESILYHTRWYTGVDRFISIEPPKKAELIIILQEKRKRLGLKLPEETDEYSIEVQYRFGVYHRRFGFDIFDYMHGLSVTEELTFWTCVSIIVNYAKQIKDSKSDFSTRKLRNTLRKSEFKEILLDNLCYYFKYKQVYFISWDELNEIYEATLKAVELTNNDISFNDTIQFLDEIGLLFSTVDDPKDKKYKSIYELNSPRFFLGWTLDTIELVQTTLLKNINRNKKKSKNLVGITSRDQNIEKSKTKKEEVANKLFRVQDHINEKNINAISKDNDIPAEEIYQEGREVKNEYEDLITENVALNLVVEKYEKKAPLCLHLKNDGTRCKNRVRSPHKYCIHHRKFHSEEIKS